MNLVINSDNTLFLFWRNEEIMKQKLVLIGNGMAGIRALEELFKHSTSEEKGSDQYDITVAYEAVKGKEVISAAVKEEEAKAAEAAKELAGNAAGGGSQGGKVSEDADLADKLIASKGNPNVF